MGKEEVRTAMINHLCDVGELQRKGEDLYEDLGGHIVHESHLDDYIFNYLKNLSDAERNEVIDGILK
jgi:hypothetical protein